MSTDKSSLQAALDAERELSKKLEAIIRRRYSSDDCYCEDSNEEPNAIEQCDSCRMMYYLAVALKDKEI